VSPAVDEPAPEPAAEPAADDASNAGALGQFIREQRNAAHLSLRALAEKADVSNPYLSQIERGLHEPSVRVLSSIARALNLSAETLLRQAGALGPDEPGATNPTVAAISRDPDLSPEQKEELLAVYRAFTASS
jgi:transcriptional regulator with XRE-family HTH domain